MKALVWTGKEQVEVQERPVPDTAGKVLIRVAYAGICGSDLGVYCGTHPRAKAPLIMGHEFSGTVEAVGTGVVTDLKPGDRVTVDPLIYCGRCRACLAGNTHVCRTLRLYGTDCDGGMAEYVAVTADCIHRLPEGMDMKLAAVVEPVAVVVHGLRMLRRPFFASACVTGLGPMGLLSALMLKDAGVRSIIAVEANPRRAAYGRKLGLDVVSPAETDAVQYVLEHTSGEGADILIEASGAAPVAEIAASLTAVRGEILLLSVFKKPASLDLRAINFKEQALIGTRVYTALDFQDAITYVRQNESKIASVVSHVIALEQGQKMFQSMIQGNTQAMKVLFELPQ